MQNKKGINTILTLKKAKTGQILNIGGIIYIYENMGND